MDISAPEKRRQPERHTENSGMGGVAADGSIIIDPRSLRIIPWLVAMAFFMQMLDSTILNTGIPVIAKSLGVSPLRMQSVVIAYLITTALLIPASGWLADRFGARRTMFGAIILFSFGSLLCAISQSIDFLIVSRVVQGVGGAIMGPVGRLVLIRVVPRRDFMRVLSFISIPSLLGPLAGPTVGGFLVQYLSWHWIFLINIPVGAIGCLLVLRHMPVLKVIRAPRFDWPGFVLLGGAMLGFCLAVEGAGDRLLPAYGDAVLLAVGVSGLILYSVYALRARAPLFGLAVFKVRSFSVGIAGNFFSRLGSGAMPFLMPLLLQVGLGFEPVKAGLTMIASSVGAISGKAIVTGIVDRFGMRRMLVVNTMLLGVLLASFSGVNAQTGYLSLLLHLTVFGMINSIQFSLMNSTTLYELDQENASSGNSILSVVMQLTMSFGVSIGALLLNHFNGGGAVSGFTDQVVPLAAFKYTYLCLGLFSILAASTFYFMPRNLGLVEPGENKKQSGGL